MLTGLIIGALATTGGGYAAAPSYAETEDTPAVATSVASIFDRKVSLSARSGPDDDLTAGLDEVSERYEAIYEGVSIEGTEVTIWVSNPIKSGRIIDLLADYGVAADVDVMPDEPDFEQAAYHFMSTYGSREYYAAEPDEDETVLVITADTQEAAEAGPDRFGTVIDGVPVEYHW